RFAGQGYEITVDIPGGSEAAFTVAALRDAFLATYAATYGERSYQESDAIEFVHFRVRAGTSLAPAKFAALAKGDGDAAAAKRGMRRIYFPETNGFAPCAVYDRYALKAGDVIAGPAVVEERESTVVLLPDSSARVDAEGNIVVDLQ